MNITRIKRLSLDFSTNILASMLVTVTLQIFIYPLIARRVSAEMYGLILTMMGIINTIVMAFGSTLNNIRLIQNEKYEYKGLKGDFNVILVAISLLGAIGILISVMFFPNIGWTNEILLIFTVILAILKNYYLVDYRLKLNFTLNLYCNITISIGYALGLLLFFLTKFWVIAFLLGEIFGCVFLFYTTELVKEPFKTTKIFRQTLSKYLIFILTGAMATALTYMDRLIMFPILGGRAVSIFTVASFFGKSIGLIMTPIAGVLLGYYAQKGFRFTAKLFWSINIIVIIFSSLFFGISYIASEWFTGLLYPSLIESAKPYILISNLAAIVGIAGSMTQPAVLKFAPIFWQMIIQVIYSIIYIALGVFMLKLNGIFGFSVSIMLANIVRLLLLYFVGHIYVKKGERDE